MTSGARGGGAVVLAGSKAIATRGGRGARYASDIGAIAGGTEAAGVMASRRASTEMHTTVLQHGIGIEGACERVLCGQLCCAAWHVIGE